MNISSFPFQIPNWSSNPKKEHKGETGLAYWQVFKMGEIHVRKVEYSRGYKAVIGAVKGISFFALRAKWILNLMMAVS